MKQGETRNGESDASQPAVAVYVRDPAVRRRVCDALAAARFRVTARAARFEEDAARELAPPPECIVLGAHRPDRASADAIESVRRALNGTPVILACTRARDGDVRRALGFGADGVVLVDRLERTLRAAVESVRVGQLSVPRGHRREIGAKVLTTREKQILALVVQGLTNSEIAARLYLAESTIKSHLSSAFAKLDVSSRYEAAGLILDPERGRGLGILAMPADQLTPSGAIAPRIPAGDNGS